MFVIIKFTSNFCVKMVSSPILFNTYYLLLQYYVHWYQIQELEIIFNLSAELENPLPNLVFLVKNDWPFKNVL